jgi:23S rRNA (cytosine1962-C5)-methyltransferase
VNSGYRLVHAEGDGLPGLIVDCLGDQLVLQFATLGMKRRDQEIAHALVQLLKPRAIVDRTPERIAKAERFLPRSSQDLSTNEQVLRGTPGDAFRFTERGFRYTLARTTTQKTGYYFDQRDLRARVEGLAAGQRVLDAYGYVGSFAMAAARGGATDVLSVDESALASEVGASCARDNGFADLVRFQRADARKVLAELSDPFDIVILDPPRLAPTRSAREAALMHYAKLASLGCRAVKPGGLLVFCSCSSAVDLFALTRALATGAQRANVNATVLERHFQAADHPVPAAFPEGLYLKALIARIEPR